MVRSSRSADIAFSSCVLPSVEPSSTQIISYRNPLSFITLATDSISKGKLQPTSQHTEAIVRSSIGLGTFFPANYRRRSTPMPTPKLLCRYSKVVVHVVYLWSLRMPGTIGNMYHTYVMVMVQVNGIPRYCVGASMRKDLNLRATKSLWIYDGLLFQVTDNTRLG